MPEYNPSFSICIPNFNYGKYIGDTIKSVLSQSYQNFEIIIVDNASTDDSVAIVKSFKDPRIKLYENNYNIGFAPNLQKVTALAKNEFINLLSSDDQMKPNALETYAGIIKSRNKISPLILLSDFEIFDDENWQSEIFFIKNLTRNDDSGRHGVLITQEFYSYFDLSLACCVGKTCSEPTYKKVV